MKVKVPGMYVYFSVYFTTQIDWCEFLIIHVALSDLFSGVTSVHALLPSLSPPVLPPSTTPPPPLLPHPKSYLSSPLPAPLLPLPNSLIMFSTSQRAEAKRLEWKRAREAGEDMAALDKEDDPDEKPEPRKRRFPWRDEESEAPLPPFE